MKFALIRERKNPPDRRVVLTPSACRELLETYPQMEIMAESSPIRTFADQEYRELVQRVQSLGYDVSRLGRVPHRWEGNS